MSHLIHRRHLLKAGLAGGVLLLAPAARACEFFTTTLRVTHPWARVTAVSGRGAIVSMVFDEVTTADRLIGVSTPVASGAELGGAGGRRAVDLVIPQGQVLTLSEPGVFVRLTGLQHSLELARTYPLTLVFEQGGTVEADLSIDYA